MNFLLTFLSLIIFLRWIHFFYVAHHIDRLIKKFSTFNKIAPPYPKVSVIVPARNEGRHIEAALQGLKTQKYSNLEIILVNDRSDDDTGDVMKKYAKDSSSWHYIEIQNLPDGWLGKNHALHQGAQKASGEYLIFTDGDVVFGPDAIEQAISCVKTYDLDHLVLSAKLHASGSLLHAMQSLFALGMVTQLKIHKLGTSPKYYIGIGAFNLVRASLYRSIGGHESIRLEIIDDIMLGKIMVQAGAKPGFMDGRRLISLEWYPGWWNMIVGLEKNSFAALRFSWVRLICLLIAIYGIYLFPYVGIFYGPMVSKILFGISVLISHIVLAAVCRRMGNSMWNTFWLPVAVFFIEFSFLRSGVKTTLQGGIVWRDTRYPLKLLKETTRF